MKPTPVRLRPRKLRGQIKALDKRVALDDKSPLVARKVGQYPEPTICERCDSIYVRRVPGAARLLENLSSV
jgi:hypothetical protein